MYWESSQEDSWEDSAWSPSPAKGWHGKANKGKGNAAKGKPSAKGNGSKGKYGKQTAPSGKGWNSYGEPDPEGWMQEEDWTGPCPSQFTFAKSATKAYISEDKMLNTKLDEFDFLSPENLRTYLNASRCEIYRRPAFGLSMDAANVLAGLKALRDIDMAAHSGDKELSKTGLPQIAQLFADQKDVIQAMEALAGEVNPKDSISEYIPPLRKFFRSNDDALFKHFAKIAVATSRYLAMSLSGLCLTDALRNMHAWAAKVSKSCTDSMTLPEWKNDPMDEDKLLQFLVVAFNEREKQRNNYKTDKSSSVYAGILANVPMNEQDGKQNQDEAKSIKRKGTKKNKRHKKKRKNSSSSSDESSSTASMANATKTQKKEDSPSKQHQSDDCLRAWQTKKDAATFIDSCSQFYTSIEDKSIDFENYATFITKIPEEVRKQFDIPAVGEDLPNDSELEASVDKLKVMAVATQEFWKITT